MTHAKRGIFSQVTQGTAQDLNAVLDFVKNSRLNSSESFEVSVTRNSDHALDVEIHSQPEITGKKKSLKKPVLVSAGLYDLSW